MTIVQTLAGEIRVALDPRVFAEVFSGALQQGMPIMKVPKVSGEVFIVVHQIVSWAALDAATA